MSFTDTDRSASGGKRSISCPSRLLRSYGEKAAFHPLLGSSQHPHCKVPTASTLLQYLPTHRSLGENPDGSGLVSLSVGLLMACYVVLGTYALRGYKRGLLLKTSGLMLFGSFICFCWVCFSTGKNSTSVCTWLATCCFWVHAKSQTFKSICDWLPQVPCLSPIFAVVPDLPKLE